MTTTEPLTDAPRHLDPYPTFTLVGTVTLLAVALVVLVAYRCVRTRERDRQRRARDQANRDPARCTCRHDSCDADRDWRDYLDGLPGRRLCLPCLYRPVGARCYAAHVHEWGSR